MFLPHQMSWHIARLDYWRGHGIPNCHPFEIEEYVFLWETEDGHLMAVLHPEGPGEAFLEIHPAVFSNLDLAEDMLMTAEANLPAEEGGGQLKLHVWVNEQDHLRSSLVKEHRYTRVDHPEYMRWRNMEDPIPSAPPPTGILIRPLDADQDLPNRSWASFRAFHPDEPSENYTGWEWYQKILAIPLYRRDLDLVGIAPDGRVAAFCTIWFDPSDGTALFEPVGVDSDFHRLGLGKAMMCEGLQCLKALGARRAYVGSYSVPAGALYASVGFTSYDLSYPWVKSL